jgi:Type I phosphodiesterase / nucleotide pyrophosphatase
VRRIHEMALLVMLSMALAMSTLLAPAVASSERQHKGANHVLLLSVDGLHASDLSRWIKHNPDSALARLAARGTTYSNASAPFPTDSFPGTLALTTGGTPKTTGVFYDNSYDRTLFPPGSNCQGPPGTEVVYDESIDRNPNNVQSGGIDPAKLPLEKTPTGCVPLYPHQFLRVNTIFNVAHDAGLLTAWSDKHPAYDLLNGPTGNGIDYLYTPEVGATVGGTLITDSVALTEANDALKVRATLNEIDGMSSRGQSHPGVPAIFGMNFQAVSVAEKLPSGGYLAGGRRFSPALAGAMRTVSRRIGRMVAELRQRHLLAHTDIIVTAKHGQSPINRHAFREVDPATIPNIVNSVQPNLVAQATQDDIALLWLTDQSQTSAAVAALRADQHGSNTAQIKSVIAGAKLRHALVIRRVTLGCPTSSSNLSTESSTQPVAGRSRSTVAVLVTTAMSLCSWSVPIKDIRPRSPNRSTRSKWLRRSWLSSASIPSSSRRSNNSTPLLCPFPRPGK